MDIIKMDLKYVECEDVDWNPGSSLFRRPDVWKSKKWKRKALEASPAWSDAMGQARTHAYKNRSGTQANKKLATDNRTCIQIVVILAKGPWRLLKVTTGGRLLCRW